MLNSVATGPSSHIPEYPKLSSSCSFHVYDNGAGPEEYVLCTKGRQFKVSALARKILERLDGRTSLQDIVAGLNAESVPLTVDHLRALLDQRYMGLGVIEGGDAAPPVLAAKRIRPGFPLLLTWELIPQGLVGWLAGGLRFLYSRLAATALLLFIALSHVPVYLWDPGRFAFSSASYLWIIGLCLLSILIHELGHAAAVSRFGGTPGSIGIGLYLLMPTFYADVSQLWRFSRNHRMVVDLGGAYFQQICFALFAFIGISTGRGEYLAACRMIDLMVLMALNPIFRFDGYWFLVDYLAIPKLHSVALSYPSHLLGRWRGKAVEPLRLPPLSRVASLVFRSYALLASVFLIAILWIAFHSLEATLTQFPTAIPNAFQTVVAAFERGDILTFLSRLLALTLLIAFPASVLIGIGLYLRWLGLWCAGRLRKVFQRVAAESAEEPLPRRQE